MEGSSISPPAAGARRAVLLVGHGGVPRDYPREDLARMKALERQRRGTGAAPGAEEVELDRRIREWSRTPETDPYRSGIDALASRLRPRLGDTGLAVAYNEFCAPAVDEAIDGLIADGVTEIIVVPSMLTPGGSHSEVDIPEALAAARRDHPGISIRYAWPLDMELLATMLATHIERHRATTVSHG